MKFLYLLFILPLVCIGGCKQNSVDALYNKPFNITVENCSVSNFSNLFDDLKSTVFTPEILKPIVLKFQSSKIDTLIFNPVCRRGYSQKFKIFVIVNGKTLFCNQDNPAIAINTVCDSLQLIFLNTDFETVHDFLSENSDYSIYINNNEKNPLAFDNIIFKTDTMPLFKKAVLRPQGDIAISHDSLSKGFSNKYVNLISGLLSDKNICYKSENVDFCWRIQSDGFATFLFNDNLFFCGHITHENHKNIFISDNAEFNGSEIIIKNHNVVFVKNDCRLPFDGNSDEFLNLKNYPDKFFFDIRYATKNNFAGKVLYNNAFCWMRYSPALDLLDAADYFLKNNYKIKIFDAYRPHSVQYIMWEVCPDRNFLAMPDKGSIHNRGCAVDLTIADTTGKNVDMGTDFDFRGRAAYMNNTDLPKEVIDNRILLRVGLKAYGFSGIKTEWWHFTHYSALSCPLADIIPPDNK